MPFQMSDLHWLAGWVEGEGCFDARVAWRRKDGSPYHSPRISIGCTDKDVAAKAHNMLGGSFYTETCGRYKPMYRVVIQGKKAIGWMMTLFSLLGKRRQSKIKEVIHLWKNQILIYSSKGGK